MPNFHLELLGTETGDSTPSLVFFFDNQRYLFNCGEGLQRLAVENSVRLVRVTDVFFTRATWEQFGGVPGMLLTLYDAGLRSVRLHGPRNTCKLIGALRPFVNRSQLSLHVQEFVGAAQSYADEQLRVVPVVLTRSDDQAAARNHYRTAEDCAVADWFPAPKPALGGDRSVVEPNRERDSTRMVLTVPHRPRHQKRTASVELAPMVEDDTPSGDNNAAMETDQAPPADAAVSTTAVPVVHPPDDLEALEQLLPPVLPTSAVCCYIVHTQDLPGKFDAARAVALGVPAGPQRGKLARGESVTLADGTVVQPSDVVGAAQTGPVVVIVHCPDTHYIEALVSSVQWQDYLQDGPLAAHVALVVHIAPVDVLVDDRYRQWSSRFATRTQHTVVNDKACDRRLLYVSAATQHARMGCISPSIYPSPYRADAELTAAQLCEVTGLPSARLRAATPLARFTLAPLERLGWVVSAATPNAAASNNKSKNQSKNAKDSTTNTNSSSGVVDEEAVRGEVRAHHNFATAAAALESGREAAETKQQIAAWEARPAPAELVCLGTGAALPSKYRNVSATYLRFTNTVGHENQGLLFDAGEGTLGQLRRRYGNTRADAMVAQLSCLLVSHMHADHHLGVVRVIIRRAHLGAPPLLVVGPVALRMWLEEYSQVEPAAAHFHFHACNVHQPLTPAAAAAAQLSRLESVPVVHCPSAFGFVVGHADGWSVAYSGDTRPCDAFVAACKDVTVMIHEATFEDAMMADAVDKRHATVSEAIDVAARANAAFLLMFHFSQRYPRLPPLQQYAYRSVGLASDFMSLTPRDYPVVPHSLPLLQLMLALDADDESESGGDGPSASGSSAAAATAAATAATTAATTATTSSSSSTPKEKSSGDAAGERKRQKQMDQ